MKAILLLKTSITTLFCFMVTYMHAICVPYACMYCGFAEISENKMTIRVSTYRSVFSKESQTRTGLFPLE